MSKEPADFVEVKVVRPYRSVDEFLEHDAWTVGRSDMLLVDQAALPAKTNLRFEIALASGQTLVRGEGWAGETVAPSNEKPGGLRVRFRRFDGESKSVLRKALDRQKQPPSHEQTPIKEPPSAPSESRPSAPEVVAIAVPLTSTPNVEESGVHHRPKTIVGAPENRDALLERLRERQRQAARTNGDEAPPAGRIAS